MAQEQITFDVFFADQIMLAKNTLMRLLGGFENTTRLAMYKQITLPAEKCEEWICRGIAQLLEHQGGYAVFVGTKSPGFEPYRMPGVSMITDGETCGPLDSALFQLGYQPDAN